MKLDKGKASMYLIIEKEKFEEEPIQKIDQNNIESDDLLEEIRNIKILLLSILDITNLQGTLNEIYQLCKEAQDQISNMTSFNEEIKNESDPDSIIAIYNDIETRNIHLAIKIYNDNDKDKIPEKAYTTNVGYNIYYTREEPIIISSHQVILIDIYIAIEISVEIVYQVISCSSLAKQGINIKGGIIDSGYTGNISIIIQNDSNKDYVIQPNQKIAQLVFLQLVLINKLKSVAT